MVPALQVNSEIGRLRTVLLKRPGDELENITPASMGELLFDDIPYLKIAQAEHDAFAATLREKGVETLYIEQLVADVLADAHIRSQFTAQFITEHGYQPDTPTFAALMGYLRGFSVSDLVAKLYAGVRIDEFDNRLEQPVQTPFLMQPLPNAYFTRDPQSVIGNGLTINRMTYPVRQVESLLTELVMTYHPRFAGHVNIWRSREVETCLEGGDVLILNEHTLAVGLSERTEQAAVSELAETLFKSVDSQIDTVLMMQIPHSHATMHLDTVFTMVNNNQFTMYPGVLAGGKEIEMVLARRKSSGEVVLGRRTDLIAALREVTGEVDLDLILTGAGDPVHASREQWNDGSNTLTIAPGEVITYDRNHVTNNLLREHGIIVHEVRSSELSRGRGGPRCMTQPIWRD
ncbi:arginine deiminase [Weissella confusa]|uniref:arginine deiminase n=1 Tax=Weissella confusa TaxID=1583 RepID=UPI00396F2E6D